MTASQNYASWLAIAFEFAKKLGAEYWTMLDNDIDRLKDRKIDINYYFISGTASIDDVIDILCRSGETELVAYIMQRLKGNSSASLEEL